MCLLVSLEAGRVFVRLSAFSALVGPALRKKSSSMRPRFALKYILAIARYRINAYLTLLCVAMCVFRFEMCPNALSQTVHW